MVCGRCIKSVINILCNLKIPHEAVLLGEVQLKSEIKDQEKEKLSAQLAEEGFELIDNKKTRIIEKIKRLIIQRINDGLDENSENCQTILFNICILIILT